VNISGLSGATAVLDSVRVGDAVKLQGELSGTSVVWAEVELED